jgi:uncharacterized membrane protein
MASKDTDHPLERLVFFSDAVFAIAITLLVIEIHAPHLPHGAPDIAHWIKLAELIPSFVAYFISFAVIGMFWMGHHRAFSLARRYDPRILGWNIAMLGVVAFMPFVTAYLSANLNERVPSLVYSVTLLLAGLLNLKVNWTATSAPMVDEEIDFETIAYVRRRGMAVVLGAVTAIVASLLLPKVGQAALISIPLWRRVLTATRIPGPRPQAEAAAPAQ